MDSKHQLTKKSSPNNCTYVYALTLKKVLFLKSFMFSFNIQLYFCFTSWPSRFTFSTNLLTTSPHFYHKPPDHLMSLLSQTSWPPQFTFFTNLLTTSRHFYHKPHKVSFHFHPLADLKKWWEDLNSCVYGQCLVTLPNNWWNGNKNTADPHKALSFWWSISRGQC